jgi:hypothetical protein
MVEYRFAPRQLINRYSFTSRSMFLFYMRLRRVDGMIGTIVPRWGFLSKMFDGKDLDRVN